MVYPGAGTLPIIIIGGQSYIALCAAAGSQKVPRALEVIPMAEATYQWVATCSRSTTGRWRA